MKKSGSFLIQIIVVAAALALLASLAAVIHYTTPVSGDGTWKEVEIPAGSSYSGGLEILKDNGIIKNKLALLLLGRVTNADRKLKAGFYHLSASLSPFQIYKDLIKGRTVQFSITIPEGLSLRRIKKKLKKTGLMDDESWELVNDRNFMDSLGIDGPSLEGYLYPDTYNFPKGIDQKLIFRIMVQRLRQVYDESMRARAEEIGMTENEVLTLASIIEREAMYNFEKPLISAVYHNRLRKKMRLQADPTVLYGVKKRWKRIRYKDLRRRTPYNTYVIKGLPPGPIGAAGEEAIKAALYPADVDYLFFVSMNNGKHYFSSSGKEHMKAVVEFQRNGKAFAGNESKKEDKKN